MQAKAAREGRMVSTVWFRYRKWRGWLGGPRAPNESIHNPLFKTARCQHWTQLRAADLTAHAVHTAVQDGHKRDSSCQKKVFALEMSQSSHQQCVHKQTYSARAGVRSNRNETLCEGG